MGEATEPGPLSRGKVRAVTAGSLLVAAALWLPSVRFLYYEDPSPYFAGSGIPPKARMLAERHLQLWTDPELRAAEVSKMRARNSEWDFMGRSFLVWSLANMALRDVSSKDRCLEVMDLIIDQTVRLERERGMYFFLMDYARNSAFLQKPERSLFLDGEIALMMAMRRVVEEEPSYRGPLAERVETMVGRMKACPAMCCESYPDECWLFCNTVALAAIRTADHLDGTDNSEFLADWLRTARSRLVDAETGMLVSSFRLDGTYLDGPEGSTIWMASHCLKVVDEDFARDQYGRARREIARRFLGFGYAREWPESWRGPEDVDSGPTIPVLGASAGASGLAFLGAASFGDRDYYRSLLASIEFGGFPVRRGGTLRYSASNQVGDAVLLYSMVRGPVWERISKGAKGAKGGGRE